eukprot:CAMPEP_0172667266 /NCGR_PEP_ID=MMETSP1074-20121228/8310_1 /TAXON_ID=2916 /ORGANISM="Ceratium fusus, Strain PA161109" /LENGTH=104 /DNA_ID=CAMNT_0013483741 /DNA_START=158 /DNA_END=472 /DNA_ORIENTATION=+
MLRGVAEAAECTTNFFARVAIDAAAAAAAAVAALKQVGGRETLQELPAALLQRTREHLANERVHLPIGNAVLIRSVDECSCKSFIHSTLEVGCTTSPEKLFMPS